MNFENLKISVQYSTLLRYKIIISFHRINIIIAALKSSHHQHQVKVTQLRRLCLIWIPTAFRSLGGRSEKHKRRQSGKRRDTRRTHQYLQLLQAAKTGFSNCNPRVAPVRSRRVVAITEYALPPLLEKGFVKPSPSGWISETLRFRRK
jgi:hypothetical protein